MILSEIVLSKFDYVAFGAMAVVFFGLIYFVIWVGDLPATVRATVVDWMARELLDERIVALHRSGDAGDAPETLTVCGLGNRKNELFNETIKTLI